MAIDVVFTPIKKLILLSLFVFYTAVLGFLFLRGLSEETYFRREDNLYKAKIDDERAGLRDDWKHLHIFIQVLLYYSMLCYVY